MIRYSWLLLLPAMAFASPAQTWNEQTGAVVNLAPTQSSYTVTSIVFGDNIGRISWETGKLVFTGKADKSARIFFDRYLKQLVDEYLKENRFPPASGNRASH